MKTVNPASTVRWSIGDMLLVLVILLIVDVVTGLIFND